MMMMIHNTFRMRNGKTHLLLKLSCQASFGRLAGRWRPSESTEFVFLGRNGGHGRRESVRVLFLTAYSFRVAAGDIHAPLGVFGKLDSRGKSSFRFKKAREP